MAKAKNNKGLEDTINPEDIIMDDDTDMPVPETKVYRKYLKVTERFMVLFNNVVNTLPYNTILSNNDGQKQRLVEVVRFIEQKKDKMAVDDMNVIISYIASLDFKHARPFMEVVESNDGQKSLWSIIED